MNKRYRKTIIAGNWKMNMLPSEADAFAKGLSEIMGKKPPCSVAICAPAVIIPAMVKASKGKSIDVGGQDLSVYDKGAYTGEISGAMLKDAGCKYVIVGHSERRQYHGETDAEVNLKALKAFENGLVPIICVGESLEQREKGLTLPLIEYQVKAALNGMSDAQVKASVIAYEPVWAIGTGKTATADEAEEVCAFIRETIKKLRGSLISRGVSILYGGSMKGSNAPELLGKPDIDGGLIGGASLKPADFAAIIAASAQG
ncbi:MAG: triose-phosphate isomerase [Oscillospiraceae bacterium]|nr:triose-phosphate isomerase [Oscillospiraceae bacterium]